MSRPPFAHGDNYRMPLSQYPSPAVPQADSSVQYEEARRKDSLARSEQFDAFITSVYVNLGSFPVTSALVYNRSLNIGTILSPEIIQYLVSAMSGNSELRVEIAKATDYLAVSSYSKFGSASEIIKIVSEVASVFRTPYQQAGADPASSLLDDELSDYLYDSQTGLNRLLVNNVWLVTFYVLTYVIEFVAGPKIQEIVANANSYKKTAI
jgi:hypothetical protein